MDKMNCVTYFTTLLFCLGFLQSLSSTPLTVEPTIINLNNSLWNGTDERNAYTLSTSAGINQTQIPVSTTSESTPPIPPDGYWNVTDGNITCIRAHLKIRFKINSENETRYLVLPPNADSSQSSCGSSQADQILLLQIDEEFDLAFTFKKDLKEHYVLENITFTLYSQEGTNHFYNDIKLFSVQKHYSYWCRSLITVSMKNVSMESFEMHIQAFGGSEKDFSQAEICDEDDKISTIVTFTVAGVLTALFATLLLACSVQRRRESEHMKLIQNKQTDSKTKQDMSSF